MSGSAKGAAAAGFHVEERQRLVREMHEHARGHFVQDVRQPAPLVLERQVGVRQFPRAGVHPRHKAGI